MYCVNVNVYMLCQFECLCAVSFGMFMYCVNVNVYVLCQLECLCTVSIGMFMYCVNSTTSWELKARIHEAFAADSI